MRKTILILLALVLTVTLSSALAMEDGVYRDKAEGYGGEVIVTVIIRDGRIESLSTENTGGEKSEYYLKAEEALTEAIIAANGIDGVDTVAGATGTSESILAAMRGILEQAAYTGAPLGAVNEMAQDVGNAVQNVAQDVGNGAASIADDVADGAENVADGVTDGVNDAVNSVKEPTMTADPKPTV